VTEILDNPRSDRVRRVRSLAGRSVRDRAGVFLVEGPQAVREAVRSSGADVRELYLTPDAADRFPEIVDAAAARGLEPVYGSQEVLDRMSQDAQQVVAVARQATLRWSASLAERVRLAPLMVEVRDPGNAGAVLRTADAAGADTVLLSPGSVDPHNPKVVRSTAGSLFHLPVVVDVEVGQAIEALRARGVRVLAASGSGEVDLDDVIDGATSVDLAAPTVWMFGNEARGLPGEVLALADAVVRIPVHGRAESLNLATAAAVCLYASARAQRHARPAGA
jgi:RNA methyltransferase, TrmH family